MHRSNPGWLKLMNCVRLDLPDIGGIDIGYAFMKNGKVYESMNKSKEAPGTSSEYTEEEISLYRFGHIEVMSVRYDIGKYYLDTVYNSSWRKKEHPDYRKGLLRSIGRRILH
jgi:hypothetical protein